MGRRVGSVDARRRHADGSSSTGRRRHADGYGSASRGFMPMAMAEPAPVALAQQTVSVTCPPGSYPGDTIAVVMPDGQQMMVQIPQGVGRAARSWCRRQRCQSWWRRRRYRWQCPT